ncbi:MAG: alpha/beta hydrolase domain-containing protein [Bryobacteraceae bacterium]
MRLSYAKVAALLLLSATVQARVVRLEVTHRESLRGGAYEKVEGIVHIALDPKALANSKIVDIKAIKGEVTADFALLKPAHGNGRLFYEVGNRGGQAALHVFGESTFLDAGYTVLWMGWQWDVPEGRMRMDMPSAAGTGQVRGNIILNTASKTASVADRAHKAYPPLDPQSPKDTLTVRDHPTDPPQLIDRAHWRWSGPSLVELDSGFEPGRIYDVIYLAANPKILGCGLAGTRDIVSYFKHTPEYGIKTAYGWGVSQSGRFLRHFLYEGFNEDEQGRMVFDGVIDEVGGAGRGSFNHRFGQASRDAEQHLNIFYPVDMPPFTDNELLPKRATPKIFHILSNSEYFNRAGALIHTDETGTRDIDPPANSRIYVIDAGPHYPGQFPPSPNGGGDLIGQAVLNPLDRTPVVRALFRAMDQWVTEGIAPPPSRFPRLSNGTLVPPTTPALVTYRLDFGPDWPRSVKEPPVVGKPYPVLVPAVDKDGNARGGIRLPEVAAPLGTYRGYNYRSPSIGAPEDFAGEAGSFLPFTRAVIEQRYASRNEYLGKIAAAARQLVGDRLLLPADFTGIIDHALLYYDWAAGRTARPMK